MLVCAGCRDGFDWRNKRATDFFIPGPFLKLPTVPPGRDGVSAHSGIQHCLANLILEFYYIAFCQRVGALSHHGSRCVLFYDEDLHLSN